MAFFEITSISNFTSNDFVNQAIGLFRSQGRFVKTKYGYNIDGLSLLHINSDHEPVRSVRGSDVDSHTVLLRNGDIENSVRSLSRLNLVPYL